MKLAITRKVTEKQVEAIGTLLGFAELGEAVRSLCAADELTIALTLDLTRQMKLPEKEEPKEEAPQPAAEQEEQPETDDGEDVEVPEDAILVTADRWNEIVSATEQGRTVNMARNRRASRITVLEGRTWVCTDVLENGCAVLQEVVHDPGKTLKKQPGRHFEVEGETYFLRDGADTIEIYPAPLEEVVGQGEPEAEQPAEEPRSGAAVAAAIAVGAKMPEILIDTPFAGFVYRAVLANGKISIIENPGPSGRYVLDPAPWGDEISEDAVRQFLEAWLESQLSSDDDESEEEGEEPAEPEAKEEEKPAPAGEAVRAPKKFEITIQGQEVKVVYVPDYTPETDFFNIRFADATYCRAFPTPAEIEEWGGVEVCARALATKHLEELAG